MIGLRTFDEYLQQALSRLPLQFRGKPRLEKLLTALAGQHQDAEAGLFTLYTERLLDSAVGAALDQLGRIVGQERGGLDDASYRLRISARLLLNRSSGTIPEILAIFALLTSLDMELTEYPPAAFELRFSGGELPLPADFAAILSQARAGGVGAGLLYQPEADEDTFTFEGGPGLGFPSSETAVYGADVITTTSNPIPLEVFPFPPPAVAMQHHVLVTITAVDVFLGDITFEYTLNSGEVPRVGLVNWAPGTNFLLEDENTVYSGLALSATQNEPYAVGDTWEWHVAVPAPGGALAAVLTA